MALLIAGFMAVLESLSSHLVNSTQYFTQLADGEWILNGQVIPTAKANAIAAAWAATRSAASSGSASSRGRQRLVGPRPPLTRSFPP